MENSNSANREMTYGEQLVGVDFNPGGHEKVNKLKKLFAEAADIVNSHDRNLTGSTDLQVKFREHALNEILNAQMCAVKAVTCKY